MTIVSPSRAKKLARSLLRAKKATGLSYRKFAPYVGDGTLHFATINRFMITKGAWLPKDKTILIALGLIKPRAPRPRQKTISEMKDRELLELFQKRINAMNEILNRRGLKVALGWIKEK